MTVYGYARVSTTDQDLAGQLAKLREAGCERVFQEKVSGAKSDRRALQQALDVLGKGDVLLATKLDRLARSTKDFLNVLSKIEEQGASIRLIDQPLIDTTRKDDPMTTALMQLIAVFAELERSMIVSRTSEGRKRAMSNGVKFGPKYKLQPFQKEQAIRMRDVEGKTLAEIAKFFNVSYQTIGRLTS
jgi:DNA invertase Pin-like site-specific DNA recombinase